MKSLRDISIKYNVTKAGLYRRIDKIPHFREKYMHRADKNHNREWLIDDEAVPLIAKPTHSVRPHHYHHATNTPPTKLEYQKRCERLMKQNEELAKTIYNLTQSNKALSSSYQKLANSVQKRPQVASKPKHHGLAGLLKKIF